LRSTEYLKTEKGFRKEALRWKDVFLKHKRRRLCGEDVKDAARMTLSLLSSKHKAGRCTRTTFLKKKSRINSCKQVRDLYLRIFRETGAPPKPDDAVFKLRDGSVLTRKRVSGHIQDVLESVGVPRRYSGSHSLRRGGNSLYRSSKDGNGRQIFDDETVKRFGRWTSDAYKLYIHIESTAMEEWAKGAVDYTPVFELN
jgi:hypothetical protein